MRRNRFLESFEPPNPQDLAVLEIWKAKFNKTGVSFDAKREGCLGDRRLEGMTLEDATDAVEGAAADDWCAGTLFKLSVIFGDRERYEAYRDAGRAIREGKPLPVKSRGRLEPRQPNTGNYSATTQARRFK